MRFLAIQAIGLSFLLGITAAADAAPLDLAHISADAAWLGHVDIDALRESTVMQKAMEKHKKAGRMEMCKRLLGMDPEKDLHGMSFYGTQIKAHQGVLILHARMDQQRILGMVRMVSKPEVSEHGAHKVHTWKHKPRHGDRPHTVAVAFHGDETIVMASSVDELKHAVDVLDGKAACLTSKSSLAGNIPAGTTMLMRAEGISEADLPEKCKLAKQVESFRFVTGEHDGESFYRARAIMTNEAVVGHVKEIIEGFRAVGHLHVGNNETGKRLVDGLRLKPNGNTLTILWSASADDVWSIVELHRKSFEERMKKYREQHGWGGHSRSRSRWGHGSSRWGHGKKPAPKKPEIAPEEDF